jgi:hypothetical protein
MSFKLPPFASAVAQKLLSSGGAKVLSEAQQATALATRLEQLGSKGALSAAEKAEHAELKKAVGELEASGWKPNESAAPRDANESGFDSKKPRAQGAKNLIDGVQNWVDNATLAGGLAGAALTAGVVTAPAGVAATAVSDVAGLVNAGVDVVQAGVAAAQGDFKGAGEQLLQAGGRALGAIPYVGTALRSEKLAVKAGVEVVQVGEKVAAKAAAKTATAELGEAAVKTFAKETAEHPAFTDLAWSLGSKFKGASLETIADAGATKQVAQLAERIRKGDVAGTTLARYKAGDAGVNDFLHDVAAKFSKAPGAKLSASSVAELGEDTVKLLGKPGAPLAEAVSKALSSGKLATKDLEVVRNAASVLDQTGNQVVRDGISAAMKKALEAGAPGKALADVVEKAKLLDKAAVKAGTGSSSLTTVLSGASKNAQDFKQTFETLLDARISPKGLQTALNPELLSQVTNKAGFDRLVSEARRMSI